MEQRKEERLYDYLLLLTETVFIIAFSPPKSARMGLCAAFNYPPYSWYGACFANGKCSDQT